MSAAPVDEDAIEEESDDVDNSGSDNEPEAEDAADNEQQGPVDVVAATGDSADAAGSSRKRGRGIGGGRGRGRGCRVSDVSGGQDPENDLDIGSPIPNWAPPEVPDMVTDPESAEDSQDERADQEYVMAHNVRWKVNTGRSVCPRKVAAKDARRPQLIGITNHTEVEIIEYFWACCPTGEIEEICRLMTINGSVHLKFGANFKVTVGEFWLFRGYLQYMLCFPEEGGNDAYWDKCVDKIEAELGTLFICHDLKRFGLTQTRFEQFVKAFQLPTNAADVASGDPFSPIRRFADAWNNTMYGERAVAWRSASEIYEGKELMADKAYNKKYGKSHGLTLRMVQPWHRSGRLVIADAGMASMATLKACADVGLDFEGNVKGAHRGLCKEWLMSQVKNRGDRASAVTHGNYN
ncbi:hypothetical protein CYMTET_24805 [Cymbomonas tetramitiformis]|uniref:PiggyBac transposable element-derived protein domain-containing protein n=1 Tax=Cymbomonas tetramitiformis TaxID=36881 RepID=A0AAE0FVL9_9CHLO|nr:hypothetical protein CYMTET_24805 [Cymbomonas tetramitiformis]